MTPEVCPVCGTDVPPRAKACPQCGACDETGWSDQARYDGLDLPDESFNHDEFVRREFEGDGPSPRRRWLVTIAAALLVLALIGWLL